MDLLVTVGIIAILAALLLPALATARLRAQHVQCLSNLGQLNRVAYMYHVDYGNVVPGRNEDGVWIRAFSRFHPPVPSVFVCPLADEPAEDGRMRQWGRATVMDGTAANAWLVTNRMEEWRGSYAMNAFFHSGIPASLSIHDNLLRFNFSSFDSIEAPSSTPVLVDGVLPIIQPSTSWLIRSDLFTGDGFRRFIARHGPKPPASAPRSWPILERPPPREWAVNVGFADGHVERVALPDLADLTWRRSYEPPERSRQ